MTPDVDIRLESVCNRAVLWTDCERGVALVDRLQHSHTLFRLHTSSFSSGHLWTGAREERPIPALVDRLQREGDSLAQGGTRTPDTRPRCDRLVPK